MPVSSKDTKRRRQHHPVAVATKRLRLPRTESPRFLNIMRNQHSSFRCQSAGRGVVSNRTIEVTRIAPPTVIRPMRAARRWKCPEIPTRKSTEAKKTVVRT